MRKPTNHESDPQHDQIRMRKHPLLQPGTTTCDGRKSPHQAIAEVSPDLKPELVPDKTEDGGDQHDVAPRQLTAMHGKTRQQHNGFSFQQTADRQRQVAVIADQLRQGKSGK